MVIRTGGSEAGEGGVTFYGTTVFVPFYFVTGGGVVEDYARVPV